MVKPLSTTSYAHKRISVYAFASVYDAEYEVIVCPRCGTFTDPASLQTTMQDDMFGNALATEVLQCKVCDLVYATNQEIARDDNPDGLPF